MPQRWHATHHKTCVLAHKVGIGFLDGFTNQVTQPVFIYPVWAARQHQHWLLVVKRFEDQGFYNLSGLAAYRLRRLFSCSRRIWQLDDLMREPALPQVFLKSLRAGAQFI